MLKLPVFILLFSFCYFLLYIMCFLVLYFLAFPVVFSPNFLSWML